MNLISTKKPRIDSQRKLADFSVGERVYVKGMAFIVGGKESHMLVLIPAGVQIGALKSMLESKEAQ